MKSSLQQLKLDYHKVKRFPCCAERTVYGEWVIPSLISSITIMLCTHNSTQLKVYRQLLRNGISFVRECFFPQNTTIFLDSSYQMASVTFWCCFSLTIISLFFLPYAFFHTDGLHSIARGLSLWQLKDGKLPVAAPCTNQWQNQGRYQHVTHPHLTQSTLFILF